MNSDEIFIFGPKVLLKNSCTPKLQLKSIKNAGIHNCFNQKYLQSVKDLQKLFLIGPNIHHKSLFNKTVLKEIVSICLIFYLSLQNFKLFYINLYNLIMK